MFNFFRKICTRPIEPETSSTQRESPDHLLQRDGVIVHNHTADSLLLLPAAIKANLLELRQAWAGAVLARIFMRCPWLESLTIELIRTEVPGTSLDYPQHPIVAVKTSRLRTVPGTPIPEALIFRGSLDALSALAVLDAALSKDATTLFDILKDAQPRTPLPDATHSVGTNAKPGNPLSPSSTQEVRKGVVVSLHRHAIRTLLMDAHISGTEAFRAWFAPASENRSV
ncbi:MAG: hypothetical protein ACOVOX_03170 [Burkholderiaceae bacterium]